MGLEPKKQKPLSRKTNKKSTNKEINNLIGLKPIEESKKKKKSKKTKQFWEE